jgi:predicted transcriptional regulator
MKETAVARKKPPRLTETQLELMKIVWGMGQATVTDVWQALPPGRHVVRTTIMNMLARLAEKGFLRRKLVKNELIYTAAVGKEQAVGGILRRLLDSAFEGSTANLVTTLLDGRDISEQDASRLHQIIDRSREGKPPLEEQP